MFFFRIKRKFYTRGLKVNFVGLSRKSRGFTVVYMGKVRVFVRVRELGVICFVFVRSCFVFAVW